MQIMKHYNMKVLFCITSTFVLLKYSIIFIHRNLFIYYIEKLRWNFPQSGSCSETNEALFILLIHYKQKTPFLKIFFSFIRSFVKVSLKISGKYLYPILSQSINIPAHNSISFVIICCFAYLLNISLTEKKRRLVDKRLSTLLVHQGHLKY